MSRLVRLADPGVTDALLGLVTGGGRPSGRAVVLAVGADVLGSGTAERFSIAVLADSEGRAGLARPQLLAEFDAQREDWLDKLELLGSDDASRRPYLAIALDPASLRLQPLLARLKGLRRRFAEIRLAVPFAPQRSDIASATLEQWRREHDVALVAAGCGSSFELEPLGRMGEICPSPIGAGELSTGLGQVLAAACRDVATGDEVSVLRVLLSSDRKPSDRPFLTILTRTQGQRLHTLSDVFCCLSAQDDTDFEHLIVGHDLSEATADKLEALVASQDPDYRRRIRMVPARGGNRTRPLNAGFENARGAYVAILDDDEIVFANWVSAFRTLVLAQPGRVARAVAVRQSYEQVCIRGRLASRAVGGMLTDYGPRFDHLRHMGENLTPPVSVAFPRYLFSELGRRFDESLTTTEDWDYIARSAALVGVAAGDEITSIYRWWEKASSSRTEHGPSEWSANHQRIMTKIATGPYIIAADSVEEVRDEHAEGRRTTEWAKMLHGEIMLTRSALEATYDELSESRRKVAASSSVLYPAQGLPKDLVKSCGLFDPVWYVQAYPDVRSSRKDPAEHFATHGSLELRRPGPGFNALWYYLSNEDIRRDRIQPLLHFFNHGRAEGRSPGVEECLAPGTRTAELLDESGLFDAAWYVATYPDVVAAGLDPLDHFLRHGSQERRSPGPGFDARFYDMTYPDVRRGNFEPVAHYLVYGVREGRAPRPREGA